MRRFLVTGGAGFIGSHLYSTLRWRGHHVRVLDDMSSGNLLNLPEDADVIFGNVSDPSIVKQAIDGMDGVFHLAAIASVALSTSDWLGTHRTNLTGLITVLDAVRQKPIPVVYASSAAVYGNCDALPIHEDVRKAPLSAYGADKLGCELHAYVAAQVHGIPTLGLRFFNVYGPRQDPRSPYSGVISIFCQQIMAGNDITIYGDGEQVRDFVYVGDVVTVLTAAMEQLSQDDKAHAVRMFNALLLTPAINVCTGTPTSVNDLAATISRLAGRSPEVRRESARPGDIRRSIGDARRLREVLGVQPIIELADGLRSTMDWMATQ